jgi:hypothetical protein
MMNRISLLNYGRLSILATKFWTALATNDSRANFNKIVKIEKKDLYAICYFSHAYNRRIKSDLEITYKESRIEEKCEVFYLDGVVNYALRNYVACPSKSYEVLAMTLKDRVEFTVDVDDNGGRAIAGDFHWILPNRTVELLGKIRGELDNGRFDVF